MSRARLVLAQPLVVSPDAGDVVGRSQIPASGTPGRGALVRRVADRIWPGQDARIHEDGGAYWQSVYDKLTCDVFDAVEAETTSREATRSD